MTAIIQDGSSRNSVASPSPASPDGQRPRRGRPRSAEANRAILDATREMLIEKGFAALRLERVAARAGVGKATIYRRWASKEDLAAALLEDLAAPHIRAAENGSTRAEMLAVVTNVMHALSATAFGPVIRTLLSVIADNPRLGDRFRAAVIQARRDEIHQIVERGVRRGDLDPGADAGVTTELLIGPVYFRLIFGGELDLAFAEHVVDSVLRGCAAEPAERASSAAALAAAEGLASS